MREDLLGYLLNALDDAERERVEDALRRDPELQRRLEELHEQLLWLADDEAEPPPHLTDKTCDLVAAQQRHAAGEPPRPTPLVDPADRARRELLGGSHSASLTDLVIGAGIFLAASFLFFPAIANSRYRSEIVACQYRLQRLGHALTEFSEVRNGLFPPVPTSGKRAVAGVYAPQLVHGEFLTEPCLLICPGSRLARQRDDWRVPTLEELDAAEGGRLARLQRSMGGSYGYTLGYQDADGYRSQRNEHRPHFALMADAPSFHRFAHQSDNHGGRGQNVLFEDMHVQFVRFGDRAPSGDMIFLNRLGYAEAGLDKEDAVIVPSEIAPLVINRWDRLPACQPGKTGQMPVPLFLE
jgi:hypothetical protein